MAKLSPPIVTCCSCMDSNSAACTFAGARLISSARIRFEKMGPCLMLKLPSWGLKIWVPMTSAGNISGVN